MKRVLGLGMLGLKLVFSKDYDFLQFKISPNHVSMLETWLNNAFLIIDIAQTGNILKVGLEIGVGVGLLAKTGAKDESKAVTKAELVANPGLVLKPGLGLDLDLGLTLGLKRRLRLKMGQGCRLKLSLWHRAKTGTGVET